MTSRTVRVDQETWEALHELAKQRGEPMQSVLARAIEILRRQYILEKTNAVYAELRTDSRAWRVEQEERREWDATLADGLDEV
jgi:predicted transcriptional regulator